MKNTKLIGNILFYSICFFLLAATIYRLAFVVPPHPGDPTYMQFKIQVIVLAALYSGVIITLFIMLEHLSK